MASQLAEKRNVIYYLKREYKAVQYDTNLFKGYLKRMICLFLMGGYTVSMSQAKPWIIYHFQVESQLYHRGKGISFLSTSFLEKVTCAH